MSTEMLPTPMQLENLSILDLSRGWAYFWGVADIKLNSNLYCEKWDIEQWLIRGKRVGEFILMRFEVTRRLWSG